MYVHFELFTVETSIYWKPIETPNLALLTCGIGVKDNWYNGFEYNIDVMLDKDTAPTWLPTLISEQTIDGSTLDLSSITSEVQMRDHQNKFCIHCSGETGSKCSESSSHLINFEDDSFSSGGFDEDIFSLSYEAELPNPPSYTLFKVPKFTRIDQDSGFSLDAFSSDLCHHEDEYKFIFFVKNWKRIRHLILEIPKDKFVEFEKSGLQSQFEYYKFLDELTSQRWLGLELSESYDDSDMAYTYFAACKDCGLPKWDIEFNQELEDDEIIELISKAVKEVANLNPAISEQYWAFFDSQLVRLIELLDDLEILINHAQDTADLKQAIEGGKLPEFKSRLEVA
jgi:hypothetical protein